MPMQISLSLSLLLILVHLHLLLLLPTTQATDAASHYAALELEKTATQPEIRKAYRKLSLLYHPDKRKNDPTAKAKFQAIGDAYETLGDPDKRVIYDEYGGQEFTSQWEFQMAQKKGTINPKSGFYKASDIVKTVTNQNDLNQILRMGKPVLMEFYGK